MPKGEQKNRFQKKDAWWILAYPFYQIIGTIRHEGSHALAAMCESVKIEKFVFWPSFVNGKFNWGYVTWTQEVSWLVIAAPYLCDLAWFAAFFILLKKIKIKHHWIWINLLIIGLLSPLLDMLWNYFRLVLGRGDIFKLLGALPDFSVHIFFIGTIIMFSVGIYSIARRPILR
ncbi:M50 family metallopeptidase [Patescibacteria group bacterium]|nr:M50 family metallopeptidase [Patescibacteria group bacterium]MBU1673050.1 M50 family metallopeptidase [Patescibacteria group bacterium]MBU1963656.1 M50 family metallopeptidase [Patescibacteria group bacterium]